MTWTLGLALVPFMLAQSPASPLAASPARSEPLRINAALASDTYVVGEPVLLTVCVTNAGDVGIVLPRPRFEPFATLEIEVRDDSGSSLEAGVPARMAADGLGLGAELLAPAGHWQVVVPLAEYFPMAREGVYAVRVRYASWCEHHDCVESAEAASEHTALRWSGETSWVGESTVRVVAPDEGERRLVEQYVHDGWLCVDPGRVQVAFQEDDRAPMALYMAMLWATTFPHRDIDGALRTARVRASGTEYGDAVTLAAARRLLAEARHDEAAELLAPMRWQLADPCGEIDDLRARAGLAPRE